MSKTFDIVYHFVLQDGRQRDFLVRLDSETLNLQLEPRPTPPPDWTRLSFQKCPHCPLDEAENPRCPPAAALADVIDWCKDLLSTQRAELEIQVEARTYRREIPLSTGVSGIIGLVMATSGCPILGKLKPMTREHLPFPTIQETLYRFLAMYSLGQTLRALKGLEADRELTSFRKLLDDLGTLNRAFCKRLAAVCSSDASLNAVVQLDCFAVNMAFLLERKNIEGLMKYFDAYLTP